MIGKYGPLIKGKFPTVRGSDIPDGGMREDVEANNNNYTNTSLLKCNKK